MMKDDAHDDSDLARRRLLTSQEVAGLLGVSLPTLSRWRADGEGPAFLKLGRGPKAPVRYRVQEVERFLSDCEMQNRGERGWIPKVA